jgi:hypothetical protein
LVESLVMFIFSITLQKIIPSPSMGEG